MSKLSTHKPVVRILSASADCFGWSGEAIVSTAKETFAMSFENTKCLEEAVYMSDYAGPRFYEPVDPSMSIKGISFACLKELLREALDRYEL